MYLISQEGRQITNLASSKNISTIYYKQAYRITVTISLDFEIEVYRSKDKKEVYEKMSAIITALRDGANTLIL